MRGSAEAWAEEPEGGAIPWKDTQGRGGNRMGGHLLPVSQALLLYKAGLAGACLSARLVREKYDC